MVDEKKETDLEIAMGFESMIDLHNEGKMILSEEFILQLKEIIKTLRS
tara:strand:+ start:724 stop:867 length:144 start_codon:yes stop_codon:yes gene_type:complete